MKNKVREKYENMHPDRIVTASNIISIMRAALTIPIIYYLKEGQLTIAFIFIVIAIISDILDGWLARISNAITDLGKMLDPFADKIVIFSVLLYMALDDLIPVYYFLFMVVRDFSIALLAMYMVNICKISPNANRMGKVSIIFSSATILSFLYSDIIGELPVQIPLMLVSLLFMTISWFQYFFTYIKEISKQKGKKSIKESGKSSKLKTGLAKTEHSIAARLPLLRKFFTVDQDVLENIEETLLSTDMGVELTEQLVEQLKSINKKDAARLDDILKQQIKNIIRNDEIAVKVTKAKPRVILFVGVNGTGKTTSIGKLADKFRVEGKSVMVAAADTFRAAAYDQLKIWADRALVDLMGNPQGKDAAAVAFDAVKSAIARGTDVLLIDTAGRLHTKSNLMAELVKIKKVINKAQDGAPHDIWLVLDANIGQNGLAQAKEFMKSVSVNGLILTKLDGTAKGGAVLAIHHKLNIAIRYIGIGEQLGDIAEFEPDAFVDALLTDGK